MAKKKKLKSTMFKEKVIALVTVAVLIIGILGGTLIYGSVTNYAVKINGNKVSTNEFKLYFYENAYFYLQYGIDLNQTDSEGNTYLSSVIQQSLDYLLQTKIAYYEAKKLNLTISDEEREKFPEQLQNLKDGFGEEMMKSLNLSDSQLIKVFEDEAYANALFEYVNRDYVRDETAFEEYFNNYMETNKNTLTKINAEYIIADSEENAAAAKARLEAGEDYAAVFKELSTDYDAENEEYVIEPKDIYSIIGDDEMAAALEMEAGQFSEIIAKDEQFIVFKVTEITPPNLEELNESVSATFDSSKKSEVYSDYSYEAYQTYNVKVNENRIYDMFR